MVNTLCLGFAWSFALQSKVDQCMMHDIHMSILALVIDGIWHYRSQVGQSTNATTKYTLAKWVAADSRADKLQLSWQVAPEPQCCHMDQKSLQIMLQIVTPQMWLHTCSQGSNDWRAAQSQALGLHSYLIHQLTKMGTICSKLQTQRNQTCLHCFLAHLSAVPWLDLSWRIRWTSNCITGASQWGCLDHDSLQIILLINTPQM